MTIPEGLGSLHCAEDPTASATGKTELAGKLPLFITVLIYLAYGATGIHRRAWLESFASTGIFHRRSMYDV